jgi:hypothetical protein
MERVAGGGRRIGGAEGPAEEAYLGLVTGIVVGPESEIVLRYDGAVGLVSRGRLSTLLVDVGPSGDHPSIAEDPVNGGLLVPDPRAQEVFRVDTPW